MTHREAFTNRFNDNDPIPDCDGELIDPNTSYSSDVYWEVFTCSKCFAVVFTVEGKRHWWNHEGEGSPVRMQQIAAMRNAREISQSKGYSPEFVT